MPDHYCKHHKLAQAIFFDSHALKSTLARNLSCSRLVLSAFMLSTMHLYNILKIGHIRIPLYKGVCILQSDWLTLLGYNSKPQGYNSKLPWSALL